MGDLISRQKVFDLITQVCKDKENLYLAGVMAAGVQMIPTVEAVPVVRGEWIAQDESLTRFMCSHCKAKNNGGHENFCPNCGADMRGEKT